MKTKINKPSPVSHTIQHKSKAANQAPLSKILQAYKDRAAMTTTVQREAMEEDDELLQGKFETTQREALPEEEEEQLQGKFEVAQRESLPDEDEEPLQQKTENKTGLPDDLKAGVEATSGYSMDDVRVHYNSSKPAQLQALAYTQGTEIHVGPGQEKHLPHEAWHVVQQKQGRVKPTVQMQGVQVNDDEGLEKEADNINNNILRKKDSTNIAVNNPNQNEYVIQYTKLPGYIRMMSEKPQSFYLERENDKPLNIKHIVKMTLAIEEAQKLVFNAISKLEETNKTEEKTKTRIAVQICFGTNDNKDDLIILDKLKQIEEGLHKDGLSLKDITQRQREEGMGGYVKGVPGPPSTRMPTLGVKTPLQIPTPFGKITFSSKVINIDMELEGEDLVRTIIHEVSHSCAATGDIKYGDPFEVIPSEILNLIITGEITSFTTPLSDRKGIWNADSYAYFVYRL